VPAYPPFRAPAPRPRHARPKRTPGAMRDPPPSGRIELRGVSGWYGGRDEACPISTGGETKSFDSARRAVAAGARPGRGGRGRPARAVRWGARQHCRRDPRFGAGEARTLILYFSFFLHFRLYSTCRVVPARLVGGGVTRRRRAADIADAGARDGGAAVGGRHDCVDHDVSRPPPPPSHPSCVAQTRATSQPPSRPRVVSPCRADAGAGAGRRSIIILEVRELGIVPFLE
jgi:hypothetical protein